VTFERNVGLERISPTESVSLSLIGMSFVDGVVSVAVAKSCIVSSPSTNVVIPCGLSTAEFGSALSGSENEFPERLSTLADSRFRPAEALVARSFAILAVGSVAVAGVVVAGVVEAIVLRWVSTIM